MHFRRGGIGLVAGCVLAAATGLLADDAAVQKDLKHLEGEWSYKDENGGEVTYKFKGDKLSVRAPNRSYRMTVKLNPAANPEKTIDFHVDEGPEDAKGKTSKGIYKFDGNDIFIFCIRPEGDRPTKYEQSGYEQILSTLKRKKS
ncbi:MAG: TIGR03067 domain-containing protein [Isosphaeraceae bacterium]